MKFVRIIGILLIVFASACGQGKYSPTVNEEIYGTWIREASPEKLVMGSDGTYLVFLFKDDEKAYQYAQYEITGKSTGSDKSILYRIDLIHKKPYDDKLKQLYEVSESGRVLESTSFFVRDLEKDPYPKKIDTAHSTYRHYIRAQ